MSEELDDLSKFEAKETSRRLPAGWLVLWWGLVVWGVWYLWTYSPWGSGWVQTRDLEGGGASMGTNLLATIAFTAIPTAAAVALILAQRRKRDVAAPALRQAQGERQQDPARGEPVEPRAK